MKIYGIDFTSAPSKTKPITCAEALLDKDILQIEKFHYFIDFDGFMTFLRRSPNWLAGVDFPLGQPRKLVENLGWGSTWAEYVELVGQMSKQEFVTVLNQYRQDRAAGDREHLRQTDRLTGAISPMKVYGVPVGKMFFEGAPRMLKAGFSIQPCHPTADSRTVLEIYPALIAKALIGKHSYKSDTKSKQTQEMQLLRQEIIIQMRSPVFLTKYGLRLEISENLILLALQDASGDTLDAILAAIQAAIAFRQPHYGIPETCDRLEGWICG
ncbi:DUF429 domain-containing protein [Pseudanabaena sp. FACHB-1998]|uniref:DUF429 domain-containing protein n=1 Tax=Pseudanabaena sp. FACHB-1998 TaxID=2692858 RepID=UPI001681A795|nr:DUF429 domain-containing protein [Pseudanabaena sp. FACHB-1998]MBD2175463.1 DUF429 domain-containing protein [Pseudanabaena sp. FACHB-1998]